MYFDPNAQLSDQTELVLNLWKSLLPSNETENMIFSPYSVITALVMLLMGAQGPTKLEIGRLVFDIGLNDGWWSSMYWLLYDDAYLNSKVRQFSEANRELVLRNGETLKEANWMYSNKNIAINRQFDLLLHKQLNASSKQLDFRGHPAQSLETINSDVNQSSGGMIPTVLDSLKPSTKLLLINTLYFHASWIRQFDTCDTKLDGQFFKSTGEVVKCPLMTIKKGRFGYYHDKESDVKAVRLGYQKSQISMVVILPPEGVPLDTYIHNEMNPSTLNTILDRLTETEIKLVLPRFNLSTTHKLIPTLRKLGIKSAFNSLHADFSGISPLTGGLSPTDVIQKGVIECTEAGTRAAAATVVQLLTSAQLPLVEFVANRPFAFALYEEDQEIKQRKYLFVGTVQDPTRT